MADPDETDEQDLAEAFDETHREDEEDPAWSDDEEPIDPDLDDRAYDATRADGDEDDEDDEEDPDDLDIGEADDDGDAIEGEPDAGGFDDAFAAEQIKSGSDEAELTLVDDLDAATGPRNRAARHYESNGPLSDRQIVDLGYGGPDEDPHQDDLLDEGLEETFPASDPVSVPHID